jgi:hypothetical protein
MPSAVAKPKNTKAPNDPTLYDQTKVSNLQDEYYRIKLMKLKMEEATQGLSAKEQEVLKQPSDLDMLTAKILVKLKTYADHDPYLNTFRAITGKESREEIAQDLATRHYNKVITDKYIGQLMNTTKASSIVDSRSTIRSGYTTGGSAVLGADGLPTSDFTGDRGLDLAGALGGIARALAGLGGARAE